MGIGRLLLAHLVLFIDCWSSATTSGPNGLSLTPSDQNILLRIEGESQFVACRTASPGTEIYWQNPDRQIVTLDERSRIRAERRQDNELDLYFSYIEKGDAGIYTCGSSNERASFNLTVLRPIRFNSMQRSQTAPEGTDFIMKCDPTGDSLNLTIVWTIDNKRPQGRFQQLPNGYLHIVRVIADDARRTFRCRAMDLTSARPDTKEMHVVLNILTVPFIRQPFRTDQYGAPGSRANLTCRAAANPRPTFEWHADAGKNNWTFYGMPSEMIQIFDTEEYKILNESEDISVLQVFIRDASYFGDYFCTAINELGRAMQVITLIPNRRPGPLTLHLELLQVGPTWVSILVRLEKTQADPQNDPRSSPGLGYSVELRNSTEEPWNMVSKITNTSSGFMLTDLTPCSTYWIRIASINLADAGQFNSELKIQTMGDGHFDPQYRSGCGGRLGPAVQVIIGILFLLLVKYFYNYYCSVSVQLM